MAVRCRAKRVCIARQSPAAIRATSISSDEACAVACVGTATAAERGRREVLIILKSPRSHVPQNQSWNRQIVPGFILLSKWNNVKAWRL